MADTSAPARPHWHSRTGFVLAAAGSAVGLGSIWKFPYITGVNGGGWFVLIYLACIVLVAIPIMVAEILIGRAAQRAPVGAFRALAGPGTAWAAVGWLGVAAAFVILSYYSVVAGWTLHYAWLSVSGGLAGDRDAIKALFGAVHADPGVNLFWHCVFMLATVTVVAAGVQQGVERWLNRLMPLLFILMLALLARAIGTPGFERSLGFVFGPHAENLTPRGVLEALGHSFFTLSLGMGAMITYGSYLRQQEDLVVTATLVSGLDTVISLMACLVVFPIIFSFGLAPGAGPGLVFVSLPIAFGQMPLGMLWAALFFALLAIAALGSAISLLEVPVSHLIDEWKLPRRRATLAAGAAILLLGVPSALSGRELFGKGVQALTAAVFGGAGKNWFDSLDYLASNWMLPIGGLGIAVFVAWHAGGPAREQAFKSGSRWGGLYWSWVWLLRYLVPVAVLAVFLHAIGIL